MGVPRANGFTQLSFRTLFALSVVPKLLNAGNDLHGAPGEKRALPKSAVRERTVEPNAGSQHLTCMAEHKHLPAEEKKIREAALDETLKESFPASDPPSSDPNPDNDELLEEK